MSPFVVFLHVCSDADKSERILLMAWNSTPLERMGAEFQYLDSAGKGLWDCVFDDSLNPIYKCRCALAELERNGKHGPMIDT